jgi:hypothetical protein
MKDALLCLNSEWQGCESSVLAEGSNKLAQELFENKPFVEIDHTTPHHKTLKYGMAFLRSIQSLIIFWKH